MSLLRWFAAPLAPLYGAVVKARNRAFEEHPERIARVAVPVVSVGNLSTGGTGKTPVTLALAEALAGQGWPNVILSRGYRGKREMDPMDVGPDSHPREAGDEPVLMARRLGPGRVIVGRKRHAAALRAVSLVPTPRVLLLDDGFQHRALHRDLDLLLLDGVRSWGNGRMLPLGDLREPMASAARASALVVTRGSRADRASILDWWERHGSGGPVFWVDFAIGALRCLATGERRSLPSEFGSLLAFCALGHPEAFYADLLVAGLSWVETRSFPDHHPISPRELERLQDAARSVGAEGLVCTEKDAVKLGQAHLQRLTMPLWVAEQSVLGLEPLLEFVHERLEKTFGSR
ncbi:MAG: tetraacyldisaccharide 4'-kinase [Holophagaceae bacterium]|nr:tetraacyldisaccharide 4'-kinase [Holophagaceae bacterium]